MYVTNKAQLSSSEHLKLSNISDIYLVLILDGTQAIKLIDEDDSWLDHNDPPHSFATSMWWRLANYTVKTSDMNDNGADGNLIDQKN